MRAYCAACRYIRFFLQALPICDSSRFEQLSYQWCNTLWRKCNRNNRTTIKYTQISVFKIENGVFAHRYIFFPEHQDCFLTWQINSLLYVSSSFFLLLNNNMEAFGKFITPGREAWLTVRYRIWTNCFENSGTWWRPKSLFFYYGTVVPELGFLELYGMQIGIKNVYPLAHYFAYQDFRSTLLNRINDASKNRSHIPHAQCVKIFLKLFLNYRSDWFLVVHTQWTIEKL